MRLVSLILDSWRGVEHREVSFSKGITLIEGPNEMGKSTIVEAIRTLFDEMDSSNKRNIKAIQPVGQDVGSRVEAEVITGDYHFIYSKTYNRGKQTELRIISPAPQQLTGREAHERAEQILDETIDRALWNALLVEQGNEIAGAYLADSTGLARALDAAAGTSSDEPDDAGLFLAVQGEYEQYFTLKTGKSQFADLGKELLAVQGEVTAASESLAEVEADNEALQRAGVEVSRLENALPELRRNVSEHEAAWKAVESITEQVTVKQRELDAAQQLHQASVEDQQRRALLATQLTESSASLITSREQLVTQEKRLGELKGEYDVINLALKKSREQHKAARSATELARKDEQHLINAEQLQQVQKQLEQVDKLNNDLSAARHILSESKIDADKLDELRDAERELQIATGKRNAVASSVEITAEKVLKLSLNEEDLELAEGDIETRSIAAELNLNIPGVAAIRVTPSQSVNDLEAEVQEFQSRLDSLLTSSGVSDLADAVAREAVRASSVREVDSLKEKIEALSDGETLTDMQANVAEMKVQIERYTSERPSQNELPASKSEASVDCAEASNALDELEEVLESHQLNSEQKQVEYNESHADFQVAKQELAGLEHTNTNLKKQLDESQSVESDEALNNRVMERSVKKDKIQEAFVALKVQLESASPEAAETVLNNTRNTLLRAEKDLRLEGERYAVLKDRLTKARANGRFEALESAEQKLDALEEKHTAILRRAEAAKRLWTTLNKHRDNVRKAYVKPLKDGIELLGKIVFGSDFSVELNESWELESRTQSGKTVPFNDLSVGAREQLGILTRLAAAQIVSAQGGVPLILDDALGFSDPTRLESMGAAIASTGKECQIILITCTPGRFMHVGNAETVKF